MKKTLYCLVMVMLLSGAVFAGCKPTSSNPTDTTIENNDVTDTTNNQEDNPDVSVDNPDNQHGEDAPLVDNPNNVDTPPVIDNPKPPVTGNNITSVDKELEPYWNSIKEIAVAAQNYYSENFNKTRLVSINGKLYNSSINEEIDVNFLVDKGLLASKYKNYECSVLLLKTEDVSKFSGVKLDKDGAGMAVFVVAKSPKENSYLVTTARSNGGILSTTDYISLLGSYGQNHGTVGRLMSGTDEYNRILNFISMYEGKFDKYYVRSITKDNKYAVVVFSSQNNVNDLKQYVLRKDGNVWEVVMDKLENESRVNVAINKKLPDFNLSLLPSYTIYDYKKLMMSDYTGVLHTLVKGDYIDSISDVKYIAGADKYCYIVLNNEVKFICFNSNDNWSIEQVADSNSAYQFMTKKSVLAPTFIIWDR